MPNLETAYTLRSPLQFDQSCIISGQVCIQDGCTIGGVVRENSTLQCFSCQFKPNLREIQLVVPGLTI